MEGDDSDCHAVCANGSECGLTEVEQTGETEVHRKADCTQHKSDGGRANHFAEGEGKNVQEVHALIRFSASCRAHPAGEPAIRR